MKKIIFSSCFVLAVMLGSCGSSYLDEEPLDFMSGNNAFVTNSDFESTINSLYDRVRKEFFSADENRPMDYIYGTDIVFDGEPNGTERHTNMLAAYHPTGSIPSTHWGRIYKMVSEANTVISRLEGSSLTDEQKILMEAKARFFRGLAYRTLAYLYGGVPITLEEITSAKNDFTRATKEETLQQAVDDIEFAVSNLPDIA